MSVAIGKIMFPVLPSCRSSPLITSEKGRSAGSATDADGRNSLTGAKLSKPFALAVRLFANMTAGHVLVLALIGLTFLFQSYVVGIGASVLATAIMLLELFVAFLQAFVFTLLTSVFIGLMRAEH